MSSRKYLPPNPIKSIHNRINSKHTAAASQTVAGPTAAAKPTASNATVSPKRTRTQRAKDWFNKALKPRAGSPKGQAQQDVIRATTQAGTQLVDDVRYQKNLHTLVNADTDTASIALQQYARALQASPPLPPAPTWVDYASALHAEQQAAAQEAADKGAALEAMYGAGTLALYSAQLNAPAPPAYVNNVAQPPSGPSDFQQALAKLSIAPTQAMTQLQQDMLQKGESLRKAKLPDGRELKAFFVKDKVDPSVLVFVIEDRKGIDSRGEYGDSASLRNGTLWVNRCEPQDHVNPREALETTLENANFLLSAQPGATAV